MTKFQRNADLLLKPEGCNGTNPEDRISGQLYAVEGRVQLCPSGSTKCSFCGMGRLLAVTVHTCEHAHMHTHVLHTHICRVKVQQLSVPGHNRVGCMVGTPASKETTANYSSTTNNVPAYTMSTAEDSQHAYYMRTPHIDRMM